MTWLILLFHVSVLYQPEMTFYVLHPDTSPKLEFELFSVLNGVFLLFMDAWNMPMFFFLAGVNSYLSLQRYVIPNKYSNKDIDIIKGKTYSVNNHDMLFFRRNIKEYRKERVHRLLVPAIFLSICNPVFFAMTYFAPLNSACTEYFYQNATRNTPQCLTWWGTLHHGPDRPTSFMDMLIFYYRSIGHYGFAQAWFCIYLFAYSQVLAFNFDKWHSKHDDIVSEQVSCCGRQSNPFSKKIRIFYSWEIRGLTATTPKCFAKAIDRLLMDPIKLTCKPAVVISLIEITLRNFAGDKRSPALILTDWANHCNFIVLYFLGYTIMSQDDKGFLKLLRKCRWWHFGIGIVTLSIYVAIEVFETQRSFSIYTDIIKNIFRGFGEWIFIIGLYSVNRNIFTENFPIIKVLKQITMPFYLTHMQILFVLVSGTFWIPYLKCFVPTVIMSTLCTAIISYLIFKLPDPIRYFFGLPSVTRKFPGGKLSGFLPLLILCICFVILQKTFD